MRDENTILDPERMVGHAAAKAHRSRLRSQRVAFGVIKFLSVLTIVILGLIVGFILYKGFRYSSETRSTVLPLAEVSPNGLSIIVNPDSELKTVEFPVLYGMYTDEYINWSKIDAEDNDLLPVAIDPAAKDGAAAQDLIFGKAQAAAWGNLVQNVPTAADAVAKVAATRGSIAVVPSSAVAGRKDVAVVKLRRITMAANADAVALVDNRQIEDLTDANMAALATGKVANWKELGGPDLAVAPLAPPAGSALESVLASFGVKAAGTRQVDMPAYLGALANKSGASGFAFAGDIGAENAAAANSGGASIASLVRKGHESGWNISFAYLVEAPRLSGRVGGISTIIVNTFYMLVLTILFAMPLGVAAAVYLVEYAKQGPLVRVLRLGTETLAGIPSIIFGLFGFLFFVNILHFGFGLLSGCLTLTLMILPTIVRTSEEALKSVPRDLREGSLALGATKLQTIARVVIPAAAPGILTGLILGIGRAVGETAALLFTMGSDYKAARGLFSSARVLSAHVYLLFAEGISFDRAFSTATVLIVIVLAFNFAAKRLVGRMSRNALQ